MPTYDFQGVVDQAKEALALIKDTTDEKVKKAHDTKYNQMFAAHFKDVKAFYDEYEKFVELAKTQAKMHMDAIENTLKRTKGKPGEVEWKLLNTSHQWINDINEKLAEKRKEISTKFTKTWRGGWDASLKNPKTGGGVGMFDFKIVDSILAVRLQHIEKQAKVWNPVNERVEQYSARASALMAAAKQAALGKGAKDDTALADIEKAYEEAIHAGSKSGYQNYLDSLDSLVPKMKAWSKKIGEDDLKQIETVWKLRSENIRQFETYGKSFSGAEKSLGLIRDSISTASKNATKEGAKRYAEMKKEIDTRLKALEKGVKLHAEGLKLIPKITELYEKAIEDSKKKKK